MQMYSELQRRGRVDGEGEDTTDTVQCQGIISASFPEVRESVPMLETTARNAAEIGGKG